MSVRTPLAALAVLLLAQTAFAEDAAPPAGEAWCQQNPQRCENVKARLKARCDADPAKCEEAKEKLQEKAAECQSNPESCKEERRAKMEAFCKNNPNRPVCQKLNSATPAQ